MMLSARKAPVAPPRIEIRFDREGEVHVLTPDGWDEDLAEAARDALHGLSPSSRENKYSRWLERYLNFQFKPGEAYDAFLSEGRRDARRRFRAFLDGLGCTVRPARGRDDGAKAVQREHGCTSDIEITIISVRAFYRSLIEAELYPEENPLDVDGWKGAAARRIADGLIGAGEHGHLLGQSGHQFRMLNRDWYPPHLHDPASVARQVLQAVEPSSRWPDGGKLLVRALVEGGARFEDTRTLHAADWAVSSKFERGILASDKGSKGKRVKFIAISGETRDRIGDLFDRRHAAAPEVPDMDLLRLLLAEGRIDDLMKWPLFPNNAGRPFTYSNFNNDYFRPTMTRGDRPVVIDSSLGTKVVTPHWLRHAAVEADVTDIFARDLTDDEILAELEELQAYYGWKSEQIGRYAAHFFANQRLTRRIAFADRRNSAEEVAPRRRRIHHDGPSELLSPKIASLHAEMPE